MSNRVSRVLGVCVLASIPCVAARAQMTSRVSVGSAGEQAQIDCDYPAISADGRYVAFESYSGNLVPGDDVGSLDVFVRDRLSGATRLASLDSAGVHGNAFSERASISADGRFVAYFSFATNLVAGDTNSAPDVFVHDLVARTTERVSVGAAGAQANAGSTECSISASGRYVAFVSGATNLVAGDTNGWADVFVRDRVAKTTVRVSVDSSGGEADADSQQPSISADGRFVAFSSDATDLVAGDTNGYADAFVHDLVSGRTVRASLGSSGVEADDFAWHPVLSSDGRLVAFTSQATNLVAGDTNGYLDVFVRDLLAGTTERVSVGPGGVQADAPCHGSEISADGRYVAFYGVATNLAPGGTYTAFDVYLRDRQAGTTERVSVSVTGTDANGGSDSPSLSADARFVAFRSDGSNLVRGDTNHQYDVFVRDRAAAGFTSLCDPGQGGVIACPCGNPAGGPGRGCDNSAGTGGARLEAAGIAYLSLDTLVFTTSGERAGALSILTQGNAGSSAGILFGMGVRCASGTIKRLYTRSAAAGSITVPSFDAGDPQVSARSAALGDAIQAGQSRWYFVYYRDPIVLGGCPSTSTFNATQTGQVNWSP